MNTEIYRLAVVDFELALIKELYKNNKIGEKEYLYSVKTLELNKSKVKINSEFTPLVLDINV
ncbi:MAG: hypothetical protein IKN63_02605 [Bacilli bacterium]|nr:hypothetical protein [Bacilli bacterium]